MGGDDERRRAGADSAGAGHGLGAHDPVGQLSPQPWMQWPETRTVIAALTADGAEVRFVGGCVRDALLHRPVKDIDIATPDPPERVVALLEAAGLKAVPTGMDHGTVTAVAGRRTFEVTTLRRDVETDGRHAVVEWSADWKADAARRDFTINAMSARPDGAVFDYFDGLRHLAHGRIVFVGRPTVRIREDVLRILRFFRFYARYGRPPPDRDALKACQMLAGELRHLSVERIRDELLKILETDAAANVLLLMRGERVLEVVLPEAHEFGRLRQLVFLETRGLCLEEVGTDPLRRLAAVLKNGPETAAAVAERLKLSAREAARLTAAADTEGGPAPQWSRAARVALLRRVGREAFRDRALLRWAGQRAEEGRTDARVTDAWIRLLEDARTLPVPEFPLRGRDVLAFGVPPGPEVGRILRDLEEWWESQDFRPDRDALLAEARRRIPGS